jgi:plasmid stabilization system protein ParE
MAYLVRISTRAFRDLEEIYESIHAESSTHAFAWFNALSEAIYSLEKNPNRGAETPESNVHRQILHGRKPHCYRIIYQVDERGKSVGVVHIRHGAMDAFAPADIQGAKE